MHGTLQEFAHKISFHPLAAYELAICGEEGITIWKGENLGKEKLIWRIKKEIKGSFTSMEWSFDGKFLALGSCYSSAIELYDTQNEKIYSIAKVRCTIREIKWTPQGHYLLASSPENEFRLFETLHFTNDNWNNLTGPINVFIIIFTSSHFSLHKTSHISSFLRRNLAKYLRWKRMEL